MCHTSVQDSYLHVSHWLFLKTKQDFFFFFFQCEPKKYLIPVIPAKTLHLCTGLRHVLLNKHQFAHTGQCCSGVFSLCLKYTGSAPVSLSPALMTHPALIGWLAHAWASNTNDNKAAALNRFLHAKLAARHISVKSWSLGIKGWSTFTLRFGEKLPTWTLDRLATVIFPKHF